VAFHEADGLPHCPRRKNSFDTRVPSSEHCNLTHISLSTMIGDIGWLHSSWGLERFINSSEDDPADGLLKLYSDQAKCLPRKPTYGVDVSAVGQHADLTSKVASEHIASRKCTFGSDLLAGLEARDKKTLATCRVLPVVCDLSSREPCT